MANEHYTFENFLMNVDPVYHEIINKLHEYLLHNNCGVKIELAKNGYLVSYSYLKTKRVIVNFVFRKAGLVIRIYGDHINGYLDFLETLPAEMLQAIDKAPVCKRLIDPAKCNSRCSMGYDFTIKGTRYQKCKYNSFMFVVNDKSIPYVKAFVEHEIDARNAV